MAEDHSRRSSSHSYLRKALLQRDQQSCIPLVNVLSDGDLLVLLSPVLAPSPQNGTILDPFEPLGLALAARHPWVRHVPYTANRGITDVHSIFIRKAEVVIFVIAGGVVSGQSSQTDMAELAQIMAEHRPLVIVACHHGQNLDLKRMEFGTVLQLSGYSPKELEEAAAVLFGEITPAIDRPLNTPGTITPLMKQWEVEALPDSLAQYDVTPIVDLWKECLPAKFHLNRFTLQNLLDRDGFGKHYVVKSPQTREIIGFCATYTTWAFSDPDFLVGSLAVLLVKPMHRNQGIGQSLYNYATGLLTRTRGVKRLQLGSTFPRLLAGIPRELVSQEWFRRRGWDLDFQSPGRGKEICDWLLKIQDWPTRGLGSMPEDYTFRRCAPEDFSALLEFIRTEESHNESMGLFEIYKWSKDYTYDIILCLYGSAIVAAALTYMPNSGSTADKDIPWPRTMGPDVGGITCICIAGEYTAAIPPTAPKLTFRRG
jgi:ribosomal protein S18 acetylase RimI-like enzyme